MENIWLKIVICVYVLYNRNCKNVHSTNNSNQNSNQCEIQINVEHSTINIQHQPTMDVEQLSRMDIQQSTNVEEENVNQSISVNSNDTNRKR